MLHDVSLGALLWEMTKTKTLTGIHTENLPVFSPTACLALSVIKQHIVSIELLTCDHEILEMAFAQKKTLKTQKFGT